MDTEKLMKSLEYDVHEDILNTTSSLIAKEKNDILQSMQFNRTQLKEYHKKLKNYRFVDEINQLKYGNYLNLVNSLHLVLKRNSYGVVQSMLLPLLSKKKPNLLCL